MSEPEFPVASKTTADPQVYGVQTILGPAYVMSGPGWGHTLAEVTHAFATRELQAVAGATQSDSSWDATALHHGVRLASEALIGTHRASGVSSTLELRYLIQPQPASPTIIRLALTAKSCSSSPEAAASNANTVVEAACASLPAIYRWVPASIEPFDIPEHTSHVEVRRQEQVVPPLLSSVPADYYYAAHRLQGDGTGWRQFFEFAANFDQSATISILLTPGVLDPIEQQGIATVATELRFHGSPRQETNTVLGFATNIPGDANAAAFADIWESYLRDLSQSTLVRISVRAASASYAETVAKALSSALSRGSSQLHGSASLTVQAPRTAEEIQRSNHSWRLRELVPWGGHGIWDTAAAPHSLRRLPYLFSVAEASAAALLPVPDEQGAPGFPRARRVATRRFSSSAIDERPSLKLGKVLHYGRSLSSVAIPLDDINRHTLVVGAPGSGKTTTVLSLATHLWREHQIPFLAIEPTKTEYRSLLRTPGMEELRVVTLGRDDVAPFRLNPLSPPPGVRLESHISAVMSAFKSAVPLDPPLPQLLEDALERTYAEAGWDASSTASDGMPAPTIRDLLSAYERGFAGGAEDYGYRGDVRGNLLAALRVRLRSLVRGSRGLLLDTVESVDFTELLLKPAVIELDDVSDRDDKAILATFVIDRIQAAARARGSTNGELRHVTIIEEAHRILGRVSANTETPQAAAVRSFCEAIAELRSKGEGFIICSQSPSALAEAAVANTGVRILHRIESAADREVVLADLDASALEREAAARLQRGEVVARWPSLEEAEVIQVSSAEGIDTGSHVSNDDVLNAMTKHNEEVRRLMPYRLCSSEVCVRGCEPPVRAEGEAIARSYASRARSVWADHRGRASALPVLAESLIEATQGSVQVAYCAASHLSANGVALAVARTDIRKRVASALRETKMLE